jgi:hypothetical protein
MEIGIILVFGLIIGIIWLVVSSINRSKRLQEWRENCRLEARSFLKNIQIKNALPKAYTNLMLKNGESAYYSDDVDLYETHSVRTSTTGYTGVRVMKRVYIGGARGTSTSSQEWTCVASGKLVITNQRLVFDGDKNDRNIPLKRIFNAESTSDGVEVSCEGRQKSMVFACKNPLILAIIIRICAKAENPSDLSNINIDIEIT